MRRLSPQADSDRFVVAIDGPAGAGKSTVARQVASRLEGFSYLDTGAMYRAVTAWLIAQDRLDADEEAMARAAEGLEMDGERLRVHGVDVTDAIRSARTTAEVSRVSAVPRVRRVVQAKQREVTGRIVAEGRDIGSVVFPQAQVKIYLDATLGVRARRRQAQFPELSYEEYLDRIEQRDAYDRSREDSPLCMAEDAVVIDTTHLTVEEVVQRIVALVEERSNQGGDRAGTGR